MNTIDTNLYLKDFKACDNCINGFIKSINSFGEEETEICDCLERYNSNFALKINLQLSGIKTSIFDYNIDTYKGQDKEKNILKIKKIITNFETKFYNKNFYFYSKLNSCQKTTLALYIGKELLIKKKQCYFVLMDSLIKLLIDENRSEEEAMSLINKYYKADFLIIDDCFDLKKVTVYKSGYQLAYLDSFLRKRLESLEKCTLFTSNTLLDNIADQGFGESIQNLIKRNCYEMTFCDRVTGQPSYENLFDD